MLRLGIDIGGSKIALAGRSDLRTLFTARFAIDDEAMPVAVLSAMAEYLDRQCARWGLVDSIAIASAPNLDSDGCVERWPNRPNWEGTSIISALAPFVRRKILWCDDGTAATLADAWTLGASNLIHFSLGTGVGGGIYFNRRILQDRELGHLLVHPGGLPCVCGRNGCLQAYVSGRALELLAHNNPADVAEMHWFAQATQAIAACSSNLIELFHSTQITLSGGLTRRFPALPAAIKCELRDKFLKKPTSLPEIRLSPHGSDASLQGALALADADDEGQAAACRQWAAV
ncbi:MAG TPA: ROK family protein [Noviherbaspirillum sp.]